MKLLHSKTRALLMLSVLAHTVIADQDPKNNFCRRYGHQSTVIDDKLYIDGGWVNFDSFPQDHKEYPNSWNSYHDLNNLFYSSEGGWPSLNIALDKNNSKPTVAGGVIWGDSVNKFYYVYGGEDTSGHPVPFHLWSYDILFDKWIDSGSPNSAIAPNIASYGAGVGVAQTGQGYYYGGWIKNTTMPGYTGAPKMSADLYKYDYDSHRFASLNSLDKLGRSEGAMVWIPAGDNPGLLVYFGGLVDTYGNGTSAPEPMNKIHIYDPASNTWFTQTAVGVIPQNRSRFCADVAWAPDKSSYNIYVWGGLSQPPGSTNVTAFSDIYILSLPSFTWVKIFPGHSDNSTYKNGHYSSSCNMIKSQSQMFVIGGVYPNPGDENICDGAADIYGQHNLWTGGVNNTGQPPQDIYWALYNPNVTNNVVPVDVYSIVGGTKDGGAVLLSPKGGYDSGTPGTGLGALLGRKGPTTTRSATRVVSTNTSRGTSSPTHKNSSSSGLPKGAIAGISVGGAIGFFLIAAFVWLLISNRVRRAREARESPQMVQPPGYASGLGMAPTNSTVPNTYASPAQSSVSWGAPPTEMPSGNEKVYADARLSSLSGKYEPQVYYPPPAGALEIAPVEMAHTQTPAPNTAMSSIYTPSPIAPAASPNFTTHADHNWQNYQ